MPNCSICAGIDLGKLVGPAGTARDFPHQKSILAAEKAGAKGCILCAIISRSFRDNYETHQENKKAWENFAIVLRPIQINLADGSHGGVFWLRAQSGIWSVHMNMYPNIEGPKPVRIPGSMVVGRRVHEPGSKEAFAQIRDWLKWCIDNHPKCKSPNTMPTRVLNVGKVGDATVRLEVTKPTTHTGHYMTLSHCWGPKPHPNSTTTRANYVARQTAIPTKSLTATFQDAIEVTRQIGIKYLWIDSLCIIQQDAADWDLEAKKMGSVYRNSFLTIAAAYSPDGDGGCLKPPYHRMRAGIKCSTPQGEGSVWITPRCRDFDNLSSSPLHNRAWVLQERILSPRTIHFAEGQMLWECRQGRRCETGVPEHAYKVMRSTWDSRLHFTTQPPRKFYWDWYDMVHDFTNRGITKGDDRLPALSGLAQTMMSAPGLQNEQYVAGLWVSHLVWGLLWHKSRDWLRWPGHYRAPSWSWASCDGQVSFLDDSDVHSKALPAAPAIQIIKAYTKPKIANHPTGQLDEGGWLQLNGKMIEIDQRAAPGSPNYETIPARGLNGEMTIEKIRFQNRFLGYAWFDKPYTGPHRLFVLRVARFMNVQAAKPYPTLFYGLLLRPAQASREFKRVGFCRYKSLEVGPGGKPLMERTDPFKDAKAEMCILK
ncbi:putative heterokaryon incompatibility protein [Naviculisporaceae sp. PSN 640]